MFQSNLMEAGQFHPLEMMQNTSESDVPRIREDECFESATKSGSENHEGGAASGDEQEPRPKRKRYHRHTQHQIQEMEAAENEKLRTDNMRYREALSNASCPNCGGPTAIGEMSFDEHHLRLENGRLREEIDRISAIAAKYVGKPVVNYSNISASLPPRPEIGFVGNQQGIGGMEMYGTSGDILRSISGPTEADKPIIIELAVAAMEELIGMAQMGDPLWLSTTLDGAGTVLNEDEYVRTFPRGIGPKPNGFKCEASRETSVVIMNHVNLVEILMDVNQWSMVFAGIVSRAMTVEVLSTGVAGNYNGALQVMTAEFQVPSPFVPTRESYFVRYCKQHTDGTWAVVDVSLDNLRPSPSSRCRRRPSGCLIQEMPNGYSKGAYCASVANINIAVTWVEHVEVDDRGVHDLYKQLVSTGNAFGAKRWVATLDRQSHTWTTLSGTGSDDVRVMTRKSVDDPGRPPGIVLSAATSFWLPVPPKQVFDFLRDENSRNEWDILSNGGVVQEMAHIANGRDTGNCVSLLRVNSNMLILQESLTDSTGSFVIYAPVDIVAMNVVLNGGDPDYVALLPSGFAILPDGNAIGNGENGGQAGGGSSGGGSLLTVAFQILVDSVPTAKLSLGSVATVNSLIACTVERIKASLSGEGA
ncbi:hypothetical protein TSUD_271100 [Trifolium subterraneum]|uniref:START domain-containing protein n=1 Tax=Trifolium subterraneum TaxID=3900 RepID=A0A2Z6N7S4_TRISU|nr:hypothetical protein TSUD_271100 [Trifolium subterraneum]